MGGRKRTVRVGQTGQGEAGTGRGSRGGGGLGGRAAERWEPTSSLASPIQSGVRRPRAACVRKACV